MSRIVLVTVAAATLAPLPLSRGASAADLLGGRGPDLLGARDRLLGARDPGLAAEVEAVAEDLGITQLARGGRASLVLVDLTRGSPVHAGIAGDSTLGAASVAKLAILVGAFAAIEKGFSIAASW